MKLSDQLLKAAEFDLTYAKEVCDERKFESHRVGMELIEHTERLIKLIKLVAPVLDAAEDIKMTIDFAGTGYVEKGADVAMLSDDWQALHKAIAKAREGMK